MSTNFYIRGTLTDVATGEDTVYEVEHIGKRSGGWTFLFQGSRQRTLEQWSERLANLKAGEVIMDEYNRTYAAQSFWDEVYGTLKDWNGIPTRTRRSDGSMSLTSEQRHWIEDRFSFSAYEFC